MFENANAAQLSGALDASSGYDPVGLPFACASKLGQERDPNSRRRAGALSVRSCRLRAQPAAFQ
jgi:hypothetical protein